MRSVVIEDFLTSLLDPIEFDDQTVILHASLKPLAQLCQLNYRELSEIVVAHFSNASALLVPTFTYGFTKSLEFDVANSPSEVGRFSEELRLATDPELRTLDPIFSVIDVFQAGYVAPTWNVDAFGNNSIWERFDRENALVVNLGLPQLVSTQLHYIERKAKVPYRFDKTFSGSVRDSQGIETVVDYNYYVRDLVLNPKWDRDFIEMQLFGSELLRRHELSGIGLRWFKSRDVRKFLHAELMKNPTYLLKKASS